MPAINPSIAQRPLASSALSLCDIIPYLMASSSEMYIVGSLANIFCCPNSLVVIVIFSFCYETLHNYIANIKGCQAPLLLFGNHNIINIFLNFVKYFVLVEVFPNKDHNQIFHPNFQLNLLDWTKNDVIHPYLEYEKYQYDLYPIS